MTDARFPKAERICSKRDIDLLFTKSGTVKSGCVIIKWTERDKHKGEAPRQVLIVVPKKRVRKAVQRNKIKRRLREIYRKNKAQWADYKIDSNKTLLIAVIYNGSADSSSDIIASGYLQSLSRALEQNLKLNKN